MQDQILDMLLKKDELTWQNILYDLVKTEQMNPWDIDISKLSQSYLGTVRKLQEMNFFVSGKVILATSILLRMKSTRLLTDFIAQFDNNLFQSDEEEQLEDFEEIEEIQHTEPKLTIKTPQARKRKVSIKDLVQALEMAIEVDKRRKIRRLEREYIPEIKLPERKVDVAEQIKGIYKKIIDFFSTKKGKLTFNHLTPSQSREDKVATFIPLLHLEHQKKVLMNQQIPFGEIEVLLKQNELLKKIEKRKI